MGKQKNLFGREELAKKHLCFLRGVLTPERLEHSLAVTEVMAELAPIYCLDREKAVTAGLLHDAAKDLDTEYQLALAEEGQLDLRHACERHPQYLHGPVGGYLVGKELEITDPSILDAISTHTYYDTVLDFRASLPWCLRSADLLAPSRAWEGVEKLRSIVYEERLEEAALLQTAWVMECFQETSIPIHPNLIKIRELLSEKLSVDGAFFERW